MAGVETEAARPTKRHRPARMDEAARDAADDAAEAAVEREKELAKAAAKPKDGDAAADGDDVAYVDGRAVVDRGGKKQIRKLDPVDHRRRAYDAVESCLVPGGVAAWNAAQADAEPCGGSATGADGVAVAPAPSFAAVFSAAPKAAWLLKGVARAGLERPTPVQALTLPSALCGRDVLAVAETGSGKTLAYFSRRGYSADESRRRRGRDVDIPWRRLAATPRLPRG